MSSPRNRLTVTTFGLVCVLGVLASLLGENDRLAVIGFVLGGGNGLLERVVVLAKPHVEPLSQSRSATQARMIRYFSRGSLRCELPYGRGS